MLTTITVDVGTTSVKLSHFDGEGTLLDSARHDTPTLRDAEGEIYDLDALVGFVRRFIRGMDATDRAATRRIAITGVGESGGLVRSDLSLASPMILWHDHRGAGLLTRFGARERELVYRVTGLPANANYGLPKIVWAVQYAGRSLGDAQWLNVSEYLAALMTGQRWSEFSLASRTMALDLAGRGWSREVCDLAGLDIAVLPELRPATRGAQLSSAFADDVGLPHDTEVHVAGHDHMVGAVGADLRQGELLNSTGTTEGLLFLRPGPSLDERSAAARLANGLSCTGSDFTLFASIPTGGSAFATLRSLLAMRAADVVARLAGLHERYLDGSLDPRSAPLVLPQFRGSPPPTKNASARGIVAGLGSDTTADDLIFGCFLGMALQFQEVLELFPGHPERVKVIGPASRNPLWLQLKADLLKTPLSVSAFPEVVSRGAQALASGSSPSWEECAPFEVGVEESRHDRLAEWRTAVRPQWEYLKGAPQ